jgi:hypothetical protein
MEKEVRIPKTWTMMWQKTKEEGEVSHFSRFSDKGSNWTRSTCKGSRK